MLTVINDDYSFPVQVAITNNSIGAESYQWTFEGADRKGSTEQNPGTLVYKEPGTYIVLLKASNADGSIDNNEMELTLDPTATIVFETHALINSFAPATFAITNNTTGAESYEWTFEGGIPETSNQEQPGNVVFAEPGLHKIKLIVGNGGETQELQKTITVRDTLVADFDYQIASQSNDFPVSIQNSSFDYPTKGDGRKKSKIPKEKQPNDSLTINYKKYLFEGTPKEITKSILQVSENPEFEAIPLKKAKTLGKLETILIETSNENKNSYRKSAIDYLKLLETVSDFNGAYNNWIAAAYGKLVKDIKGSQYRLQRAYNELNGNNNDPDYEKTPEFLEQLKSVNMQQELNGKMLKKLKERVILEDSQSDLLKKFKKKNADSVYGLCITNKEEKEIIGLLEYQLADFYDLLEDK
ncbi:MAG: PKD domain-containing protein [Bacteroidota bacterium]